ncbi:MAG: hypothetical protein LC791_04005 [Acidobacteria bacterium]|nr:hypothetical protein [Acidobacteriota bacterium]
MYHVARAPAMMDLRVRVVARAENRMLRVSLDSGSYFRSSDLVLEGDNAPAAHPVRWPGIPAGTYALVVELRRSSGQRYVVNGGSFEVFEEVEAL